MCRGNPDGAELSTIPGEIEESCQIAKLDERTLSTSDAIVGYVTRDRVNHDTSRRLRVHAAPDGEQTRPQADPRNGADSEYS